MAAQPNPAQRLLGQRRRQGGFSLVEIMVAVVIGMITVLAVAQTFSMFEGQRRTTVGGVDSQDNGLMALFLMERDARMAGMGLASDTLANCTALYSYYDSNISGVTPGPLYTGGAPIPVRITNGASGGPDTITFTYGDSYRAGAPGKITDTMPQPSAELNVSSVAGFNVNDMVVAVQGGNCTLMQVTQLQNAALKLQHNPNSSGPSYNPPAAYQSGNSWPAYTTGAQIYNMGQLTEATYSVGSNRLRFQDLISASATPLVNEIVDLQAQYGIAPAGGNQQVNCWVNATATGNACDAGNWAAPTAADAKRIKAIRISVVARSTVQERPDTAGNCSATPSTTATNYPASDFAGGPTLSVTGLPNWQCYRYKVFETVVPLRNVLWANI